MAKSDVLHFLSHWNMAKVHGTAKKMLTTKPRAVLANEHRGICEVQARRPYLTIQTGREMAWGLKMQQA